MLSVQQFPCIESAGSGIAIIFQSTKEIYLRVSIEVLMERDQKQLYSRALKGEVNNIMGIDLEIDEPEYPDAVIDNDGSKQPTIIAKELFEMLCTKH